MLKIETIKQMMTDPAWSVRYAAMNACRGRRDVPIDLIEKVCAIPMAMFAPRP